ncbi:MAG: transporter substrate-binding domain-containing protein [Deltaproteobacteria bacterium]|nr:transporter substrate-binding domain-containing protein [Deltaproteobacteria bacterium]
MKKSLFIVMTIVMILCHPVSSQEIRQVTFVSDPWPPFTIGKEGGPAQGGISIELCREIFSRLGLNFTSQILPWKRALGYLKTGEADLTFPLVQNQERSTYIAFTDIVMNDKSRVWFLAQRKGSPIEWETVEDLKPYTIGVVNGYSHGEIFQQAIEKGILKTERCMSYEQGIRKLLHSRMDILLGNESVINSLIRSHPEWKGKLKFTPKFSSQHAYRIGISRKSPVAGLIPEINRLILEMKTDGTIDQILSPDPVHNPWPDSN